MERKRQRIVRTYENDLAPLTLIGDVSFEQTLTAASADGGEAANQHIVSGLSTMVVETIFPSSSDEHITIATRLEAKKYTPPDMLSGSTSRNILAMTFRQVVCQSIWSFQLAMFSPGTERNMDDLENQRELFLKVLKGISTRILVVQLQEIFNIGSRRIASKDGAVFIYEIHQDEILANVKPYLKNFEERKDHSSRNMKVNFSNWASEYIPAYRLQIDTDILKDVKLGSWRKSEENRWKVHLTHSQMFSRVGLAEILDMYYEDVYTLLDKQLSSGV
ncbi:hypothetical protein MKX01_011874, partial [Papaver californicum]